jgi:predicted transcriptional regulator
VRLATTITAPADEATMPTYGQLVADVDAIDALRRLMPARALSLVEARSVAERQAATLLDLMHITEPLVPMFVIHSLPGISVEWRPDLLVSGMSVRTPARWRIAIRAEECRQRQRFSLAHEFKHVLDSPVIGRTHTHLKPERREDRAERLCDYFAACLLMPRPWVKHDYYGGLQNSRALARRYYVSQEAMTTRLRELGLVTNARTAADVPEANNQAAQHE